MTVGHHGFDAAENVDADYGYDALTKQKRGLRQMLLTGEWRAKMEAD